jgi:KaiC/GvpD/RAD55 family RecA-like ATPase
LLDEYHISKDWEKYEEFRLKKKTGLTTGFPSIDKEIRALPGFITLVGDTGLGKSYFTMNVFLHLARTGIPVILLDLENGRNRTRTRILSYLARITPDAIQSGKFINGEKEKYEEAVAELSGLPIYYFNEMRPDQLETHIKDIGTHHKKRVFVVIDSINRLIEDFEDRRKDIDMWSTLFNNLKVKYENFVNIWAICEENEKEGIKESGTTKHITELWLRMAKTKDKTGIFIECKKHRDGPVGIMAVLKAGYPFCFNMEEVESVPE